MPYYFNTIFHTDALNYSIQMPYYCSNTDALNKQIDALIHYYNRCIKQNKQFDALFSFKTDAMIHDTVMH